MKREERSAKAAGLLAALLWIVFGITLVIRVMAGDGGMLAAEMLQAAPPEVSGLPAEEYPDVGAMIASYLTGGTEEFQYREYFQPHEAAHMADCRELIRLDLWVCVLCGAAAAALTAFGLVRRAGRERFLRGILWGLRTAGVIAAGLGIWALVNFNGLFVTFHKVAFTNDGWLLNPKTDLLLRLMPTQFFTSLGIRGLLWALLAPAALEILARTGLAKVRDEKGDS